LTIITPVLITGTFKQPVYSVTTPITTTDSFAELGTIHKEDYSKILLQFINTGANSFNYEIYGNAINSGGQHHQILTPLITYYFQMEPAQ